MKDMWTDGIFGVVTGDALGCPVEFTGRETRKADPVTDMRGYGTFHLPAGSWTDDSSLTLAALDSLGEKGEVVLPDIMRRFAAWYIQGDYTPYGEAFDVGRSTAQAILRYLRDRDVTTCGGRGAHDNGNGSLMRIMPVCLWCFAREQAGKMSRAAAMDTVHAVSALTHSHLRSRIACGLYYCMAAAILGDSTGRPLRQLLQEGITAGRTYYEETGMVPRELALYRRLWDMAAFADAPESSISSSGYVVDTLEAAVWTLLQEESYAGTVLRAVNLGRDTDTVAAIAGGLAGLYYGAEAIPAAWRQTLARREWIEELCGRMQ